MQAYIRAFLAYRFVELGSGHEARRIDTMIRRGDLRAGKPLLNPLQCMRQPI